MHQNQDQEPHRHARHDLGGLRTRLLALLLLVCSFLSSRSFLLLSFFVFWTGSPSASVRPLFRPQAQDDLFCSSQQFWPVCPGQFVL